MKILNIVSLICVVLIISCYDVDVTVTRKQPQETSQDEHIDLTTSDSQNELIAYIDSLRKKRVATPKEDQKETTGTDLQLDDKKELYESNEEDILLEIDTNETNQDESQDETNLDFLVNEENPNNQPGVEYNCLNQYLPPFIDKMSTGELSDLADLIDSVCNNKNFIQFFEPDFGWRGDPKDRKNFVKILKEEQVPGSTKYDFIIGMKFLLPQLKPSYVNDVFRAYTDNEWFASNYIHPDNMDVKIVKINTPINAKGFDIVYSMIMNFEVFKFPYSVRLKSNFVATRLSENFTVFTERSLPNKQMSRRHISFLDTSGPVTSFTVFEYRQVESMGLIGAAKMFMEMMDASMMKAVYDNALIQTNK